MAYLVIYGSTKTGNKRNVLATVPDVRYKIDKRVFDLSSGTLEGRLVGDDGEKIKDPIIYTLHEEDGTKIYEGFTKNVQIKDNVIKFISEDFRKILDSDVLLDFSHGTPDIKLSSIFNKVMTTITERNDFDINIVSDIAVDNESTSVVADYTGRYVIAKALNFLKVYLSYYGYWISTNYNQNDDTIQFKFEKSVPGVFEIRLKDFVHNTTKNDIKVNKTIAAIKFNTRDEADDEWVASDVVEYNNAVNKSVVIADEPPNLNNYEIGWVIKLIQGVAWVDATAAEYNASPNKLSRTYFKEVGGSSGGSGSWVSGSKRNDVIYMLSDYPPSGSCTVSSRTGVAVTNRYGSSESYYHCEGGYVPPSCPSGIPSINEAKSGLGTNYDEGTVVRVNYVTSIESCYGYRYIKLTNTGTAYYRRAGLIVNPRPDLPEKVYVLGTDNNVYENAAPNGLKPFPEVVSYYEAEYLADAQFNAIYYLLSNRWVENIIIDDTLSPFPIHDLPLFQMVRVYDESGIYKDLPISEHHLENNKKNIKLGFKKTSFTSIIKNDIAEPSLITKK